MRATFVTLCFLQRTFKNPASFIERFLDGKWNHNQKLGLRILPQSRKGISAELNLEENAVVLSIFALDIEAVLERIGHFGGKVLKSKTPIGEQTEHRYFALFEDPNGNEMCLYSEK